MKLHSLFEETVDAYIKRLYMQGIKKQGSGVYSTVFQHPKMKNVVVKLIRRDKKNAAFLQHCSKISNPYLPKVFSMHEEDLDGETIYLAFMEKLQPCTERDIDNMWDKIKSTLDESTIKRLLFSIKAHPNTEDFSYRSGITIFKKLDYLDFKLIRDKTSDAEIKELMGILYDIESSDLHTDNLMSRNGVLVFVDP